MSKERNKMYFAGAAGFGSKNFNKLPVVAAEKAFQIGTADLKPSIRQTQSMAVVKKEFHKEKTRLQMELDRMENRQTSEYMALLGRIRTNAQRPDKDAADRTVAVRLEEVMYQGRCNIATFRNLMCDLRERFDRVCEVLEKECVDEFVQSGRWRNGRTSEAHLDYVKMEIAACLDDMHQQMDKFILDQPGSRSLGEVYDFTLEKYEEFERKVAELKNESKAVGIRKMKRKRKMKKNAWWEWIINVTEMLLIK